MSTFLRHLKRLKLMSWPLTLAVGLLLTIGVLFVYSSCYVSEELPVRSLYRRQLLWAVIGLLCYFGFAITSQRNLSKAAWWAYGGCLFLLVAVLFVGRHVYGARRWLMLFNIGVQPSELAKLAVILLMARIFSQPERDVGSIKFLLGMLFLVACPMLLILVEPDLGTAMVFIPIAFAMLFVGGASTAGLAVLISIGILLAGSLVGALYLPEKLDASPETQERVASWTGLSEYQQNRIRVFFEPQRDLTGVGWNKMQSEIAVGSGGLRGKGFLKGDQNILGFLPRSVAPTDFIYSVIAEEMGFVGSTVVLGLFAFVVGIGTLTAVMARDRMGRMLCVGIITMIFFHVFTNIAMTVGLMPITGLPLPLLSYGGTFMVVMMSSLGIIQGVCIRSRRIAAFQHGHDRRLTALRGM